jgi:DNA-binding protein H-NS
MLISSSIPILLKQESLPMPLRNSPSQIRDLDELSQLSNIVSDKRRRQRSLAKKSRRNRHYEMQFIRNTVMRASINPSEEQMDS